MATDYTGMIFKYKSTGGKISTWLISGPPYKGDLTSSPAVKCTVTGKTFKGTNGFGNSFLEAMLRGVQWHNDYEVIRKPGVYPTATAYHKDSIEITKLKNRISYLNGVISSSQRQLKEAEEALDNKIYCTN